MSWRRQSQLTYACANRCHFLNRLRKRQQRPIAVGTYDLERNGIGLLIQWVAQLRCPLSNVRPTAILSLTATISVWGIEWHG